MTKWMRLKISDGCRHYQDLHAIEQIDNILWECPALMQRRLDELGACFLLPQIMAVIRTTQASSQIKLFRVGVVIDYDQGTLWTIYLCMSAYSELNYPIFYLM